jgi:hypothetical protein
MNRALLSIALLPTVLGAVGCFDVHNVGGPWVIDDFENGDLKPADPNFGPWGCSSFNESTTTNCSYGLDPGDASAHALFLDFTVDDPPDGVVQEGGALLQTGAGKPEDFSRFNQMVLSAKLVSGNPPLPSTTEVYVELGCTSAQAEDGTRPGNLYVVQSVAYTDDWQTFTLSMANFGSPAFDPTHLLGGPTACLERVDDIYFAVEPLVPDGQSAMGRLDVDDIYFQ